MISFNKIVSVSILTAFLAGCAAAPIASAPEPTRSLAAATPVEDEWKEKVFHDVWNSSAPATDFMAQMGRLVNLYLRGQKFLMDFDQDQSTPDVAGIGTLESYHKLQVIRGLQEQQSELMVYLYGRFIDQEKSQNPENHARAAKVLSAFARYMLGSRNNLNRLAMQDFVRDLRATRAEHEKLNGAAEVEFQSPDEISSFLDGREGNLNRRDALAIAAKETAAQKDPEFDAAYSEYSAERASAGRAPQSQIKFAPDPGPSGNLWGHEVPMGTFAITFDDGPSKEWTPQILQVLKENQYHTTFFWLAKNLRLSGMDQIVARAKAEGHTLGNHSFTHADLSKPDDVLATKFNTSLDHEILDSTNVDRQVYGFKPSYFRCPYGSCVFKRVERVRKMIADLRMLHVTWTIDSLDWQDKDPQSVYNRVVKQAEKNGRGIILFHDIHPQSYAASTMLIRNYFAKRRNDLRLLTVSQIVRELNSLPQTDVPQNPASQNEQPAIFKWLPWGQSE